MGYPYNELVAPAVLLNNQGVTREEFIELLDQTHSSFFGEYKPEDAWNSYNKEYEDERYHNSLEGLASILGLEYSNKFEIFQQPKEDENNLFIRPPFIIPADKGDDHKFEVIVHEKNIIEVPRVVEALSWDKLNVGSIWEECQCGVDKGIVTKIFKKKYLGKDGPQYKYRMQIKPLHREYREEKFKTLEELYEKWPEFHPDFVYDWSRNRGEFKRRNGFFWLKENNKYCIDEKTFDSIPACGLLNWGYTDLILTAEAVKHNAWKILSYRGLKHFPRFLHDFPDSRAKYERAIWNSHTSIYARNKGLSISDFLRFRMQAL